MKMSKANQRMVERYPEVVRPYKDAIRVFGLLYLQVFESGKLNRIGFGVRRLNNTLGPADLWFAENGTIACEKWMVNGRYHRVGGPALTVCHYNGKIGLIEYCHHGFRHRMCGPALFRYSLKGKVIQKIFAIHGVEFSVDEWRKLEDAQLVGRYATE